MAQPTTANGTTISWASSSFSANIVSIAGLDEERPALDDTHLGTTTYSEVIPGDLVTPAGFEVACHWDIGDTPPITAAAELITITYPLGASQTVNGTLSGTGFVTKRTGATLENNNRLAGSFEIMFDGKTGPTYTAGS